MCKSGIIPAFFDKCRLNFFLIFRSYFKYSLLKFAFKRLFFRIPAKQSQLKIMIKINFKIYNFRYLC